MTAVNRLPALVDCGQLANATSLPDTYRLLSVFSGIPLDPESAIKRAGLAETDQQGRLQLTDRGRNALRVLLQRGLIRWVNWQHPGPTEPPIPPGYVLTGQGEMAMDGYFNLYGPTWTARSTPQ